MSNDLLQALPTFAPAFAAALLVNLEVAALALGLSLLAGLPLAWLRSHGGAPRAAWQRAPAALAGALTALLRASPTFVVMFFMLHALPPRLLLGGWTLAMTPALAVALALTAYGAAYVSDNTLEALMHARAGRRSALLLLPMALLRGYFVMVLSSGFGSAVGLTEATAVTMRSIESLPQHADRLALAGLAVLVFVLIFQSLYALTDALRRRLLQRFSGSAA
jgi:hypothetical protein